MLYTLQLHSRASSFVARSQLILSRLGRIPVFITNFHLTSSETWQKTYAASPEGMQEFENDSWALGTSEHATL